jgi:DNA-binding MarR family transcriptional regulator
MHPALARHTGFLLSRMGMVAQKHFAANIAAVGLHPRMWGALNVLDAEGEITQLELGRRVGVDPSTMVATIDELEAKGFVERRRNPTDRRAHALHITAAGRKSLAEGRKLAQRSSDDLFAPLDPAEREQLHDLLTKLANAV